MSHKTFIIIVTYNAMPWLDQCLGSIDLEQYDVLVVDNNSIDETCLRIESEYSQIKLFKEQQNLGFGQANNIGMSYALNQGAEQVFLMNQDSYLVDDCLEQLIEFQKGYPEFGILSPIHINADQNRLDCNFSNYVKFDVNPDFYSDHVLENKLKPVYVVPFVNAAGWLISKECLMTVGGFDPIFFHYGEDDNYCQRVLYHGFDIGVIPKVFLIHDREDRPKVEIEKYSEAYFEQQERLLKLMYANVNEDTEAHLEKEINRLKSVLAKERLKLRWVSASNIKKQLELVLLIKEPILKSRAINKRKGRHYL